MTAPLRVGGRVRVGGRATTIDGAQIVWSLAEGKRGSRWREALTRDGSLVRSVLFEASPAGRMTRLEVTTTAGLLTLHPDDRESTLHGNVVGPGGVRHLRLAWSPEHELLLLGSPATAATALRRLGGAMSPGDERTVAMVRVDDLLEPREVSWVVARTGDTTWLLRATDGAEERRLTLHADGFPVLGDAVSWPLEGGTVEEVWTEPS